MPNNARRRRCIRIVVRHHTAGTATRRNVPDSGDAAATGHRRGVAYFCTKGATRCQVPFLEMNEVIGAYGEFALLS